MIRRPVSGVHVCLGCRIRLSRRSISSIPRRRIRTDSAAADDTSTTQPGAEPSTHGDGVSQPASRSNTADLAEHSAEQVYKNASQATHNYRSKMGAWKRPLGRLLGGKENGQWETSEVLDVEALGKKAEVIVLRDAKFTSILPEQKNTEEAQSPQNIDILEQLRSERGIVSEDEVFSNINNFRPTAESNSLSWDNLIELVQVLDSGFTFSQMNSYIKTFDDGTKLLPSLAPDLISTNGIVRVSAWVPDVIESSEPLKESVLTGYFTPSFTAKQIRALQVVRQCWQVVVPEIEECIGQAEVQLNPEDLELLIKQGFLESISANYLFSELEKIEVFRNREVVRITSNRDKAALIVHEIEDAVRHITRMTVLLRPIFPKTQDRGLEKRHSSALILKTVGELTNTAIKKENYKGEPQIVISNIEYDAPDKTSTKHEVARRLLLTSSPLAHRESLRIERQVTSEDQHGAFMKYEALEGLPWHQRLQKWHRWAVPIAKEKASGQKLKQLKQDSLGAKSASNESSRAPKDSSSTQSTRSAQYETFIGEPDDMLDLISGSGQRSPTSKVDETQKSEEWKVAWSPDDSIETSAVVGRILHSFTSEHTFVQRAVASLSKPETLHTFSSDISNLSRALRDAPLRTRRPIESLIMRFKPNPWAKKPDGGIVGAAALTAFPLIEMRFSINFKTRDVQLRDVKAIKSADTSDLMLPQSTFDLRFQRRVAFHMIPYGAQFKSSRRRFSKSIEVFVSKCNLDLSSTRPLETPASLEILLEDHICSPGARALVEGHARRQKPFPVDYLFAGLEYRSTMVFDFDGWETAYTSIEGGKAGGSASELRLLPIRTDQQPAYEEDFMQSAYKLVDAVGSNTVLIAKVATESRKNTTALSFTNIPGREGRFKFWAYRPSDFTRKGDTVLEKRTIAEIDEEWQNKQETAINKDSISKVEDTIDEKEYEDLEK